MLYETLLLNGINNTNMLSRFRAFFNSHQEERVLTSAACVASLLNAWKQRGAHDEDIFALLVKPSLLRIF